MGRGGCGLALTVGLAEVGGRVRRKLEILAQRTAMDHSMLSRRATGEARDALPGGLGRVPTTTHQQTAQ